MDIKDIMGIKGDAKAPAAKKSKGPAEKKPEGVSREVWQITKGMQGDALAPVGSSARNSGNSRKPTAVARMV